MGASHRVILLVASVACACSRDGATAAPASGPMRVVLSEETPAAELALRVRLALHGLSRPCWLVWGDVRRPADARIVTFEVTGAKAVSTPRAWVTCPERDGGDVIDAVGDPRVKRMGVGYFRGDHFEYKAPTGPEARLDAALALRPESGSARDLLSRLDGVTSRFVFAFLPMD